MRLILKSLGGLTAALLLTCASLPARAASDTIVVAMDGDVKTFNIAQQFDNSWFPSTLYFERLVAMDYGPEFKARPELATSWDISPDGTVYTFHLREGVKWHDGQPFTSRDVKYTFQAALDNKTYVAPALVGLVSMETPDPLTFVMKLKEPSAPLIANLATYPRTAILPAHIYEGTDFKTNPANTKPIGTGPYRFEEQRTGEYISFVRNEDYWGKKPVIRRIVFRIVTDPNVQVAQLQSGEIQAMNLPPATNIEPILRSSPGVAVDSPPGPLTYYLAFNMTRPPFDNLKVRQALALAIDRKQLADRATFSTFRPAAGTFVSAIAWAYDPSVKLPDLDIAKAKAMLDEAGYPEKNGTRFAFDVWVSLPTSVDAAQIIKTQLKPLGIDVRINQMEDALLRQRLPDLKQDSYIYGNWWGPDPSEWGNYNVTGRLWNRMGYSNKRVDELFDKADHMTSEADRKGAYSELQKIMLADMPRLPLFDSGPYSFAHRSELVGWFSEAPYSYRMDLRNLRWK